jgi:hypothetical protein
MIGLAVLRVQQHLLVRMVLNSKAVASGRTISITRGRLQVSIAPTGESPDQVTGLSDEDAGE